MTFSTSVTVSIPPLWRGKQEWDIRATTRRDSDGNPIWPLAGNPVHARVNLRDGDHAAVALFADGKRILGVELNMSRGLVYRDEHVVLPVVGERSLTDFNVVPRLSLLSWC